MFKLRDQLLLTLVLIGLIPSVIISYDAYSHNRELATQRSIELAQKQLNLFANKLSNTFEEAKTLTQLYARSSLLSTLDYESVIPFLEEELTHLQPKYEKFIIGFPNGHFYNTSGANAFQGGIRTFDDSAPDAQAISIKSRDYWQQTVGHNSKGVPVTYISNPMLSFTTGVKQIVVASSIFNDSEELIGMLGLSIPWQYIHDLVQSEIKANFTTYDDSPKVMLVSDDGTYWYHWDQAKIIQVLRDEAGKVIFNAQGEEEVAKFNILAEESPALRAIGRDMVKAKSGVAQINLDNASHLAIYQALPDSRYSIAIFMADKLVMAPVTSILNHTLIIIAFSLLLTMTLGLLFARVLSRPISELIGKISLLSQGEHPEKTVKTKTKELQVLTDAIFNLYHQLHQQSQVLEKSQERFSLVIKATNDGIWDWNFTEQSLFLSPRWKEIIGYSNDEIDNSVNTFQKHIHPDEREIVNTMFKELIKSDALNNQSQFRMVRKDGEIITVLVRSMILRDENNRALRIVGSNTDISELIEREQEVIALNKDLEFKVLQRTHDIVEALKEAEDANLAKSTFLSNMSHEIRTPMNGIIGLTNLCLDTELSEQQREYLEKVNLSSKNLLRILNEILDFNKIESGMVELEQVDVNLVEIAEQVESLMKPSAEEKGISFNLELDESLPTYVLSDPFRLSQVLLNLCGNAIKFTHQGRVSLSINHKRHPQQSSTTLTFSIKDTGVGIKNTKELFTAFKQEDASTTRIFGGTGLGLTISHKLVMLLGGRLHVESEVGQGSCFSFSITVPISDTADKQLAASQSKPPPTPAKLKNKHILLVEDNAINQLIADEMLKIAGYQVTKAVNGQEAVDYLRQQTFDLVLMDVQMPIMDGLRATEIIRNELNLKSIPIIALTANVLPEQIEQYLSEGFSGFIGKPFYAEDLLSKIESLLPKLDD